MNKEDKILLLIFFIISAFGLIFIINNSVCK